MTMTTTETTDMPQLAIEHVCDWRCEPAPVPVRTPERKALDRADGYRRSIAHSKDPRWSRTPLPAEVERFMRQFVVMVEAGDWRGAVAFEAERLEAIETQAAERRAMVQAAREFASELLALKHGAQIVEAP
jgi:hypothetical protein